VVTISLTDTRLDIADHGPAVPATTAHRPSDEEIYVKRYRVFVLIHAHISDCWINIRERTSCFA
jgi:hypothetical protein